MGVTWEREASAVLDLSQAIPDRSPPSSPLARLTSASEDVARQLESTHRLAEETAQAQKDTLLSQEQILRDGELLRQTLQDSSQGVRQAFRDLQDSSVEQRVVFAEIFNHVAFLHRFVVGKSHAVYSVLFHLVSVAAVLALTSSQQTSGARFILLASVGASVYLESVICSLLVDNLDSGHDLTESLSFWVGLCRWGFAALGLAVLAYFIWSYKDPVKQSRKVLESLQETQVEFRRLLQETERLLAERDLLLHSSGLCAKNEVSFDSGVPEQLSSSECGAEETEVRVERHQGLNPQHPQCGKGEGQHPQAERTLPFPHCSVSIPPAWSDMERVH
ncbi:UNVERIFIED_CONTAM: hypothetical protein K2H54_048866 [Gekko kuhli]